MPTGSFARSLKVRSLKESNKELNRQSIQDWPNLMPHYLSPPLELWFRPSAVEICIAKCNKIGQAHP